MPTFTPAQALENLARVAEVALLNGADRRAVNASIEVLNTFVTTAKIPANPAPPKPAPPPPAP